MEKKTSEGGTSPAVGFASAASDFDDAMSRFKVLHSSSTSAGEGYLLGDEESVVDKYRFPKQHDKSFITPLDIAVRTNLFSVSWIVVLTKIFDKLKLSKMDTLVHMSCGDGRWMIEAASKVGCRCIGYDVEPNLEYRCDKRAFEQELSNAVDFRLVDDILDADLGEVSGPCLVEVEHC